MHHSRLAGFIIDCDTDDLDSAAEFWSKALGYPASRSDDPAEENYVKLETPDDEIDIEVQKVSHESRLHLGLCKSQLGDYQSARELLVRAEPHLKETSSAELVGNALAALPKL